MFKQLEIGIRSLPKVYARCCPPGNRVLPAEFANCRPYLRQTLSAPSIKDILCIGRDSYIQVLKALEFKGLTLNMGFSSPRRNIGYIVLTIQAAIINRPKELIWGGCGKNFGYDQEEQRVVM